MSLAIDVNSVTAVLLPDGWHKVADRSFDLDSYEFVEFHPDPHRNPYPPLSGGQETLIPACGFRFIEDDDEGTPIEGPLTSVVAVRRA
ncbi:hypothetical protein [Mycobacterium sp. 1164985.4]|uniref:hypothetical protein n=1 Tax=Mycobacterium sp. 1164985.4 TaxID=1834069 RepID=UPI0008019361|nr:hypothetical protein [Mycobacterium sp. 1164985.4]OBK75442.1 hypothetical protein A5650_17725 [Mycobacterium sp. 1164985.4]